MHGQPYAPFNWTTPDLNGNLNKVLLSLNRAVDDIVVIPHGEIPPS